MLTLDHIVKASINKPGMANLKQAFAGYKTLGERLGITQPHRAVQYFAQLGHESLDYKYDKEIWGPTAAQKRYDIRTDLGNTPERDGDGKLYTGRGPIQITGKYNYQRFTRWCKKHFPELSPPDFVAEPHRINEDPWEGLVGLWYWDDGNPTGKSLNRYADEGDNEMITRRINGGLNGYQDRLDRYTRLGLVVLGYGPDDLAAFQRAAKTEGIYKRSVDGLDGPGTRAAIHQKLVSLTAVKSRSDEVKAAPVVEETEVIPPQLEKPIEKSGGLWERIGQIVAGVGVAGMGALFDDWRVVVALGGMVVLLGVTGLFLHKRLYDAVKTFRELA